ncbi:MAG TPA: glutaredoxin domain-containing protein [Anaerolineaceae bacterium]|nr:glutaredoxin domain-containing protein [Anaerolineaceae bacterium]
MENQTDIIMYGTTWCGDTRRARRFFDEHNIPYKWIDIDQDMAARKLVEEINHGFRSVPTIIFPDGSKLVEPTTSQLAAKLGIPIT